MPIYFIFGWCVWGCGFISVARRTHTSQEFATMRAFANDAYMVRVYFMYLCIVIMGWCLRDWRRKARTSVEKHRNDKPRAGFCSFVFCAPRGAVFVVCIDDVFRRRRFVIASSAPSRSTCVHANHRMDDVVPLVFRIENAVRSDVLFVCESRAPARDDKDASRDGLSEKMYVVFARTSTSGALAFCCALVFALSRRLARAGVVRS